MPGRPSLRRVLACVAALVLGVLVLATGALWYTGIPRNAAGMAAKGVCSAAFVAGRPWQTLLADDVLPASPALTAISVEVDEAGKRVKGRFAGMFEREARLLPLRGCVLDAEVAHPRAPLTSAPDTNPDAPWPEGEAPLPVAHWGAGVDAAALQALMNHAFEGAGDPQRSNTRAVAIVHRGRLLASRTAPGFDSRTALHGWSMTKTVVGMLGYKRAAETGLPLDTPVVAAFDEAHAPGWLAKWRADSRRDIKVSDLLYMRDGLASTESYQPWGEVPQMLWGNANAAAFAAAAPAEAPAGQRWRYLSQTANIFSAVVRSRFASDTQYWAYPQAALFGPIGATTAVLETDTAGNWVGSSYLWASVGDWARLGQLMLADGRWGSQQVLPPGWLRYAATRATADGEGRGYGAQTWRIGDPEAGECKGYGLPPDTLAMSGHWGQIVAMVPSRDLVAVRLGWTFQRGQFNGCAFVAEALKAVPG